MFELASGQTSRLTHPVVIYHQPQTVLAGNGLLAQTVVLALKPGHVAVAAIAALGERQGQPQRQHRQNGDAHQELDQGKPRLSGGKIRL